ncbi:MAG TPA: hypothetical protein VEZ70_14365 [Allosphingosinicella sp.]|nr:hypothetical protein [Allosphingosinicella sp.]
MSPPWKTIPRRRVTVVRVGAAWRAAVMLADGSLDAAFPEQPARASVFNASQDAADLQRNTGLPLWGEELRRIEASEVAAFNRSAHPRAKRPDPFANFPTGGDAA